MFGGDVSHRTQPKRASFEIKNEFKVQPPKGAKTVRMWFAVPQEDAVSVVREFRVAADFPRPVFPGRLGKPGGVCGGQLTGRRPDHNPGRVWANTHRDPETQSIQRKDATTHGPGTSRALRLPATFHHVIVSDQIRALAASIRRRRDKSDPRRSKDLQLDAGKRGLLGKGPGSSEGLSDRQQRSIA